METVARMIIQEPLEVYEAPRYINITQLKDITVVETMLIIIVVFSWCKH